MSRRDTIIVAVLVNAALLMILFATATRPDRIESSVQGEVQLVKRGEEPPEEAFFEPIASVPTLAPEGEEELIPLTEEVELAFTPTPVVAPEPKMVHVTVKEGDFLEKIAKANQTSVAAIMKANNITSTQLKIGQMLKVPLSEKSKSEPSLPQDVEAEFYVVKEGDNPWLIASRNKIPLSDLLRLNDLDEQKARRIRPGDRLRIR